MGNVSAFHLFAVAEITQQLTEHGVVLVDAPLQVIDAASQLGTCPHMFGWSSLGPD